MSDVINKLLEEADKAAEILDTYDGEKTQIIADIFGGGYFYVAQAPSAVLDPEAQYELWMRSMRIEIQAFRETALRLASTYEFIIDITGYVDDMLDDPMDQLDEKKVQAASDVCGGIGLAAGLKGFEITGGFTRLPVSLEGGAFDYARISLLGRFSGLLWVAACFHNRNDALVFKLAL